MKASNGSVKTEYLGFGYPLWPCEKIRGYQVLLLEEAQRTYKMVFISFEESLT